MRIVTEIEFRHRIAEHLVHLSYLDFGFVTGPGRSGAIAAVYASHLLGVPFIPYKTKPPIGIGRALLMDTARESGETMRRAARLYAEYSPVVAVVYEEPPRVAFWYEAAKPQRYRHERAVA